LPARTPSYCLHKSTAQAVVTFDGRDFYLGKHGTPSSLAEYGRLIAEWLANGRRLASANGADLTAAEPSLAYFKYCEEYGPGRLSFARPSIRKHW
jgi:hypothetical protein